VAQAERVRLTYPAARRLRRKSEFDQLYARGRRLGNSHFGITMHPNELGLARLGLAVASKPFGGSVPADPRILQTAAARVPARRPGGQCPAARQRGHRGAAAREPRWIVG